MRQTTTTFQTATGSTWSLTGAVLQRHSDQDGSRREVYEAVANAVDEDGVQQVVVRVSGTITFVDRGIVKTTGRVVRVLGVRSVSSAA